MEEHCSRLADVRPLRFSICVAGHWPHVWPMFLGPWLVGTQWSSCQRMCQARTPPTAYWVWALQVLFRCWNLRHDPKSTPEFFPNLHLPVFSISLNDQGFLPSAQSESSLSHTPPPNHQPIQLALPSKPIWNLTTSHHSHWSRRLPLSPELL